MKKNILFLLIASTFIYGACKERGTGVIYTVPPKGSLVLDSQYTASGVPPTFPKVLLVEDFSGVHCVNCPLAGSTIDGLIIAHPGKLIDIVMYSSLDGSLSDSTFPGTGVSSATYRTSDADVLRSILGPSSYLQLPQISLDRKLFITNTNPKSDIAMSLNNFNSYFPNELSGSTTSPANITISGTYDAASHTISGTLEVQYGSSVADSDYVSVAIKENKLINWQEEPGNGGLSKVDMAFVHNSVLRKYIYPQSGILLPKPSAGKTYLLSFNTTIPSSWNPANLMLVGILHKQNAANGNYYVSQAAQDSLK